MMKSANFYTDNLDLQFHLQKALDFKPLFALLSKEEKEAIDAKTVDDYVKTWIETFETLGSIAGDLIATNAPKVDKEKIKFTDGKVEFPPALMQNLTALKEYGVASFGIPPRFGGLGAPFLMTMIGCEIVQRACPSTMLNISWYSPIAHPIERFGSEELKERFIPMLASGEASGNMALTEADAGSDLSQIKTYAEREKDGSWRIYGAKRFISNGSSEIGLVLAMRKKGVTGLNNLCLFICPKNVDGVENVKILKLEGKIGLHGSATTELSYEGSKAWLLGKEGEGFHYMLLLMNESRLGVGFQGIGAMEATFRLARDYAHQRKTWGKPLAEHELIAEKLLDMEVEIRATRSLGVKTSFYQSMISSIERLLADPSLSKKKRETLKKDLAKYSKYVRSRTPLLKYWVGEKANEHARTCMQIHGGYGFTTEFTAEFWLREALILALYEGTTQIQALMSVKDTLKEIVRNPRKFVEIALASKVKWLGEPDPLKRKLYKLKQMRHSAVLSVLFKLIKSNAQAAYRKSSSSDTLKLIKALSRDMVKFDNLRPALLHAERLCEMKCHEKLAEALIEDIAFDEGRRWIAERFINKALPKVAYLKAQIENDEAVIERVLDSYAAKDEKNLTDTGTY